MGSEDPSPETFTEMRDRRISQGATSNTKPCKYCGSPVAPTARCCPGCDGSSPAPADTGIVVPGIIMVLIALSLWWLMSDESGGGSSVEPTAAMWYEGGTLRDATMSTWSNASHRNKLATCADLVAQGLQLIGKRKPSTIDLDRDIRHRAEDLLRGLDNANADGSFDRDTVVRVATTLMMNSNVVK